MKCTRDFLAFVHIEKAAGTTLNHILRRNFLGRFIDVRPLSIRSDKIFTANDLFAYLRINPFLSVISGHSIKPYRMLHKEFPGIRYFTVLRDPVTRYMSQFQHLVSIGNKPDDFKKFLAEDEFTNYQTRKIAGIEDLNRAKEILDEMVEVGVVEEFNTFLLRLRKSLAPVPFSPYYEKKNIARKFTNNSELLKKYRGEVALRNEIDQELYDYIVNILIPRRNQIYGQSLSADLARFEMDNATWDAGIAPYADYALRKLYYEPVTGLIRLMRGLPAKGSY